MTATAPALPASFLNQLAFFASQDARFKEPLVVDGFAYYTDGHLFVRVPYAAANSPVPLFNHNGVDWSLCAQPDGWLDLAGGQPSYQRPYDLVVVGTARITAIKAFLMALLPGPVQLRAASVGWQSPVPIRFNGGVGFVMQTAAPLG